MTKAESRVHVLNASQTEVFGQLSDLTHFESLRDRLPADKAKVTNLTADSITVEVQPVGPITLEIVEREPEKCIKFASVGSSMPLNLWIQLLPMGEDQCRMKITIGVELNPFMAAMAKPYLQDGVEKLSDGIAKAFA